MLSVDGMEELRRLARRLRHGEATEADRGRIRGLLAEVDPAVRGYEWWLVEDVMMFALGLYAFGYLGQKQALREARGEPKAA